MAASDIAHAVDGPGKRVGEPLEGLRRLHQHAKRERAGDIVRCEHEDGEDRQERAIGGGKRHQPEVAQRLFPPGACERVEPLARQAALGGFALGERDRFRLVADVRQPVAKVGFARLLLVGGPMPA